MKALSQLLVATLLAVAGCAEDDALHLDRVTPTEAAPGTEVQVQGIGLCGASPDCRPPASVSLGQRLTVVRDDAVSWQDDELRFVVPEATAPGAGLLVVTVGGQASNPVELTIVPGPGR